MHVKQQNKQSWTLVNVSVSVVHVSQRVKNLRVSCHEPDQET